MFEIVNHCPQTDSSKPFLHRGTKPISPFKGIGAKFLNHLRVVPALSLARQGRGNPTAFGGPTSLGLELEDCAVEGRTHYVQAGGAVEVSTGVLG